MESKVKKTKNENTNQLKVVHMRMDRNKCTHISHHVQLKEACLPELVSIPMQANTPLERLKENPEMLLVIERNLVALRPTRR